jgi:hypothetical protein
MGSGNRSLDAFVASDGAKSLLPEASRKFLSNDFEKRPASVPTL